MTTPIDRSHRHNPFIRSTPHKSPIRKSAQHILRCAYPHQLGALARGAGSGRGQKAGLSARFKFADLAGDKSWVAGVELATASEPPVRRPRIWGRRPPAVDPSHPEL